MSIVKKRICDKCKSDDKTKMFDMEVVVSVPLIHATDWPWKVYHYDLCADCARAFKAWIGEGL